VRKDIPTKTIVSQFLAKFKCIFLSFCPVGLFDGAHWDMDAIISRVSERSSLFRLMLCEAHMTRFALGVDIGGTKIAAAVVDDVGVVRGR
jgi:hypothetical protein